MRHLHSRVLLVALTMILLLITSITFSSPQEKPPQKSGQEETPQKMSRIQVRKYEFKEAEKEMEYTLYVPSGYNKKKQWPLMIALHGFGSNPHQIIRYPGLTKLAEKYGYIVAAPMGYNSRGWYGSRGKGGGRPWDPENLGELSEQDVLNVLARMRKEFSIDDQRIYLMGHSMGGGGTFHLGMKYPDIWAALGPIAPAIYGKPDALEKIKHIPVIVVQGEKDRLVKVGGVRKWVAKMKELGMVYTYIEVPGGNHLMPAFQKLPQIFEFFNKHKKRVEKTTKKEPPSPASATGRKGSRL